MLSAIEQFAQQISELVKMSGAGAGGSENGADKFASEIAEGVRKAEVQSTEEVFSRRQDEERKDAQEAGAHFQRKLRAEKAAARAARPEGGRELPPAPARGPSAVRAALKSIAAASVASAKPSASKGREAG